MEYLDNQLQTLVKNGLVSLVNALHPICSIFIAEVSKSLFWEVKAQNVLSAVE